MFVECAHCRESFSVEVAGGSTSMSVTCFYCHQSFPVRSHSSPSWPKARIPFRPMLAAERVRHDLDDPQDFRVRSAWPDTLADDEPPTSPMLPSLPLLHACSVVGAPLPEQAHAKPVTLIPPSLEAFRSVPPDLYRVEETRPSTIRPPHSLGAFEISPAGDMSLAPPGRSLASLVEPLPPRVARSWIVGSLAMLGLVVAMTSQGRWHPLAQNHRTASASQPTVANRGSQEATATPPPIVDPAPPPAADANGVTLPPVVFESPRLPAAVETKAPAPKKLDVARSLLEADTLRKAGDAEGSLSLYRRIVEKEPRNSEARTAMGEIALAENDIPSALSSFRLALAYNAGYLPALVGMSDALVRTGDRARARDLCQDIVARFPDDLVPMRVTQCASSSISK